MNPRRIRWRLVLALSLGAAGLNAGPAGAYNEENVKSIRMERLDPVACAAAIRIAADLRDRSGNPVAGAEVTFTYKKSEPGDTIAPTTAFSDAEGLAQTTIRLSCLIGSRIVRASVSGDGSAQLVVTCNPRNGCTIKPHGGTLRTGGSDDARTNVTTGDARTKVTTSGHVGQVSFGEAFRWLTELLVAGADWAGHMLVASGI